MSSLTGLIKKIGIFMIAAQAVIHFAPGQKYEKYLKLIVGIMIFLQLVSPIYSIFEGTEVDWSGQLSNMEQEISKGLPEEITDKIAGAGIGSSSETAIDTMEKEIKSKLNDEISGENYTVAGVKVSMRMMSEKDENGIKQYELDKVRVVVWVSDDRSRESVSASDGSMVNVESSTDSSEQIDEGEDLERIEKVQIQKISIAGDNTKVQEQGGRLESEKQEIETRLRERFCSVLGIKEKYMEVTVYGTDEEDDR